MIIIELVCFSSDGLLWLFLLNFSFFDTIDLTIPDMLHLLHVLDEVINIFKVVEQSYSHYKTTTILYLGTKAAVYVYLV